MKSFFKIITVISFAFIILIPNFLFIKPAYAACSVTASWTRNLKPVTVKEIYADDIDQYILVLEIKGCAAGDLIGVYTIGGSVQGQDLFPAQQISGQLTKSIKFGRPAIDTYHYQFAVSDSTGLIQKRLALDVVYKAGSSPVSTTNTNTPNTNSANTNGTLGGSGISNINTSVGASLGNLDEKVGDFFNPLNNDTLPELLGTILKILFAVVGILATLIIIVAGFRMVISSGNTTEIANAKKAITWAIIGLVLSMMAFSIVAIIQRIIRT